MSAEAIAAMSAAGNALQIVPPENVAGVGETGESHGAFDAMLNSMQNLNAQMIDNENAVSRLAVGQTDNLHQAMIASERTRLDFELVLAVRNKILDAYQELMRLQV